MTTLSSRENFLVFVTVIVVCATIALSLCIGLILPDYMTLPNTISNWDNKSTAELKVICRCSSEERRAIADCKLHSLPNKIFIHTQRKLECNPDQTKDELKLMESFSYLGSVTVPAYVDNQEERRLACSCIIITSSLILVGQACIQSYNEEDLNLMELRVGSIYWSKCGTRIHGLSYFHEYRDAHLYRVNTSIPFNNQTQAVRLPIPGVYRPVTTMVTPIWEPNKLHTSFYFKKWTTNLCKNFNTVGEIISDVYFAEKVDSLALVTEDKLLIGFLGGIEPFAGKLRYLFADLQCDTYPSWLIYSTGTIPGPFLPVLTECHGEKSVMIYEGRNCHSPELSESPPKPDITNDQDIFEPVTI